MNRLLKLKGVAVLLVAILLVAAPKQNALAQPNVNVTFQTFYNDLQPYGQWVDNPEYGYCWVPNVDRGFRPYYSNGYWAMTEYGNTWVSNYSWGWAPFHYGNWTLDPNYGWMWVPGTTWGPAWVTWRNGGGHYGWAPIAPGISITVATSPRYYCNNDWWVFVPQRNIYSRTLNYHWRGARYNNTYIRQTTIINNTYVNNNHRYVTGPGRQQIQRATGMNVRTYGVRSGMKPGKAQVRGNTVNVYRPNVRKVDNERPQRVVQAGQGRTNNPRGQVSGASTQRTTQATQQRNANVQRAPQRSTQATQQRNAASRAPQRTTQAAQQRNANVQRAPQRSTQATQQRSANVQRTPQRQNVAQNTQPNRQAAAQQQQQRITDRRQQSWQGGNQSARQQNATRSSSSSAPTRTSTPVNRNTQRARPQSQSRPQQQSRAAQRTSQPQRSNATRSSGSNSSGNSRRR